MLLNRKKVKTATPVRLSDGALVDIPGYQLRFHLTDAPAVEGEDLIEAEELEEIPSYFYIPPPPPPSPVLMNLIEDRESINIWSEGVTTLKVADIVEETADVKTFRLVGEKPILFSYRPAQFVTFLLNIDGEDVEVEPIPATCLGDHRKAGPRRSCFELAVRPREIRAASHD